MNDLVYALVFDGLSDWEPALALAAVNGSDRYTVQTVGFTSEPVVTAAGLRVVPDGTLDSVDPERAAALVIPGGTLWEEGGGADGTAWGPPVHE